MKKAAYHVTLDLTKPNTHRAQVTIEATGSELPPVLQFPVWTPGSYLVREYSRHVTRLEPAEKMAKNKWRVRGNPKRVRYEVYGMERTVRTTFIDDKYVVLVGASLLPLLQAGFSVEILLPKTWKVFGTSLPFKKVGPGRWKCDLVHDDEWIDCPIVAASPGFGATGSFRLKGISHKITWVGFDCARSMREMEEAFKKIADATLKFFGGSPFRSYHFLLHFGNKLYGGLEHRDSQLSQFDGTSLREPKDWDAFLRLIAHEYFHSWNVKSLRPKALGPFDYTQENYTEDLWFAEGLTDYFDDMIPWHAGLISDDQYWKARLKDAQILADGLPAQRRRSVAESSFDAWIRYYRPDEDSLNTDVSYYTKGALLGWCWDAHLVKNSRGKWTLAKLMRELWKEFGVDAHEDLKSARPGFNRAELLAFSEKKTGIKQAKLVESWVKARAPLPWRQAAHVFGIKLDERVTDAVLAQTGITVQWKGTQAVAGKIASESSAERAGIAAGDEILAVNGRRVTDGDRLTSLIRASAASRKARLLLSRLDHVFETTLTLTAHPGLGTELQLEKRK